MGRQKLDMTQYDNVSGFFSVIGLHTKKEITSTELCLHSMLVEKEVVIGGLETNKKAREIKNNYCLLSLSPDKV